MPSNARAAPQPLPPETRTVGQLVAEAVRFYGQHFWRTLALGVLPAAAGVALAELPGVAQLPFALVVGAAALSFSFARATALVAAASPTRATTARAVATGVLVLVPAATLLTFLGIVGVFPAVAWLAYVGLVVPVIVLEGRALRDALRRATQLARADFVHAMGSLAAVTIVALLTAYVMFFLLRSAGEAAVRAAAFLSVLVISPLLLVGAALLYFDQAARVVGSGPRPRRRRDADVHPAVESDRPGRADAEVKPRSAARGEP